MCVFNIYNDCTNLKVTFIFKSQSAGFGFFLFVCLFSFPFFSPHAATSKTSVDFTIKRSVYYSKQKTPLCLRLVKQN